MCSSILPLTLFCIISSLADVVQWIHDIGPVMIYLAQCEDGDCSTFNGSDAQWFKIDQMGLRDANAGTWYMRDLCESKLYSPFSSTSLNDNTRA